MSRGELACKVYVGELDPRAEKKEVEDCFAKCGRIRSVWVARNPPGFAFVEYEDPRDAEDAVRHLDGSRIGQGRVRVEMSRGGRGRRKDEYREQRRYSPPRYAPRSRSRERRRSPSRERSYRRYSRSRSRSH